MLVGGLRKLFSVLLGTALGEMEPPPHAQEGSGGGEPDLGISIPYIAWF